MADFSPRSTPKSTPKRKRGEASALPPIAFSFDLYPAELPKDGSNSPRSKVALRFQGLALGSGGGVAADDTNLEAVETTPKRQRQDELMGDALGQDAEDGEVSLSITIPEPVGITDAKGNTVPYPAAEASLRPLSSSPDIASNIELNTKARAGTPPPCLRTSSSQDINGTSVQIFDPVRAALTWHEDEITMYDPNDKDDDGTGINGIGFRPTPALAHARIMKRRQQMADYRRREESDARGKRNQKRRGDAINGVGKEDKPLPSRRVRFIDASERRNVAVTTG